ncbi:MAG: hypothetical protein ACRDN9_15070 [Streptosporangiaceae bacterium]
MAHRHRTFLVVFLLAVILRCVVMLGYRGVLWFPDSRAYLGVALRPQPYPVREMGYAFFLRLLLPVHSFAAVAGVQHLMGLAVGVMVYALLRHRFALPGWGASLAAVPVLFDGQQLQLEHMLLSDTLFELLVVAAVVMVSWRSRPAIWQAAAGGGLVGLAATTRSVGLPLIAVLLVVLLMRRVGWRRFTAAGVLCLAPVVSYAVWYHGTWGRYALSNSGGLVLFARTAAFVDCTHLRLPPDERALCPRQPPGHRSASPNYLWHHHLTPALDTGPYRKFTVANNERAGEFAKRAIVAQPVDYLTTSLRGAGRTFEWPHGPYPNHFDATRYRFPTSTKPPGHEVKVRGGSVAHDARRYAHNDGRTRVKEPYAGWLRAYQRYVFLPGTVLGVLLVIGATGLVIRWRRLGGPVLLVWFTALALIVVPPFTASYSPRYVIPAVPLVCVAAAAALGVPRRSGQDPRPQPPALSIARHVGACPVEDGCGRECGRRAGDRRVRVCQTGSARCWPATWAARRSDP